MLYRLKSDKDTLELNPGARAIAEFDALTGMQFFFVCLVADTDRDNPIKSFPEKERRAKAATIAGYGMEGNRPDKNARNLINGKVESVEKAIAKYRELQYDEDEVSLEAVNTQVSEVRKIMSEDKEKLAQGDPELKYKLIEKATNIGKKLPDLLEARRKLLEILDRKNLSNMKYKPTQQPTSVTTKTVRKIRVTQK